MLRAFVLLAVVLLCCCTTYEAKHATNDDREENEKALLKTLIQEEAAKNHYDEELNEEDDDDDEEFDEIDDYIEDEEERRRDPRAWWSRQLPSSQKNKNHYSISPAGTGSSPQMSRKRKGWRNFKAGTKRFLHSLHRGITKLRPYIPHVLTGVKAAAAFLGKKKRDELIQRKLNDRRDYKRRLQETIRDLEESLKK